ncbi:pilus assembly protein N-terminal domain-containing protein [Aestuariivirga sp.]|uniref:pilus assembly protein N-terminal domain-containing protein n=1 Tax=Aestuariivirga sp. TaxID=2650926 RepID=UPI00391BF904
MSDATKLIRNALGGLLLASGVSIAAAEPLTLQTDKSRIIELARAPGTVVVGNPSIADITLSGNLLFLHGKAFGNTNIIVLDEQGREIVEYDVNVTSGGSDYAVVMFKSGKRESYDCKTDCQPALQAGDSTEYFDSVVGQISRKSGSAQSQPSGETSSAAPSEQPAAP